MKQDDWSKYLKKIEPRLDELQKQKKYLEMVFLIGAVIERELQYIVERAESLITTEVSISGLSFDFKKYKLKDANELTLGQLKDRFSVYCNNNNIISEISKFNALRIKCIHKIFDQNIDKLNFEIANSLQRFYKLLYNLSEIAISFNKEEIKQLKKIIKINQRNIKNREAKTLLGYKITKKEK